MASNADPSGSTLAPDEAFAVLGNETRMEVLQALAEADGPLPFSELRDRVGVSDSGQFNYHLDKLAGHFVEAGEDGYGLRRAGQRVIEAVVSGAVTETPVLEPTVVEFPCSQCSAPSEMSYQEEWVALSCTACEGLYGEAVGLDDPAPDEILTHGYLGGLSLPSAAIEGRTPEEVVRTSFTWDFLERIARSKGICPRCAAAIDRWLKVCEDHDAAEGLCEHCGSPYRVRYHTACPNCRNETEGLVPVGLHGYQPVIDYLTDHGFDPVEPTAEQWETMTDAWEETVVSTDPPVVEATYRLDGDVLRVRVDEEMEVLETERTGT